MAPAITDESDSENIEDLSPLEDLPDDEIDEELDDEEEEIDEIDEDPVSEDDYKLEDPDDIDDDLELKDDYEEPVVPVTYSKQPPRSKRRTVSYYEDDKDGINDDLDEEDEVGTPIDNDDNDNTMAEVTQKSRPEDLDPDLILTDEETEYNPNNHQSRLTERQRRAQQSDFIELGNNKKQKLKKETEEEVAVRKAENARRRLDYKNKQLEEEKRDTLNKLLKRRATKVRDIVDDNNNDDKHLLKPRRPMPSHPGYWKYITNTNELQGNSSLSFNL